MNYTTYETSKRTGYITLNNPVKKNAFNASFVIELTRAFEQAESDPDCKVIVLQSNGDVFSAGADLGYLKELQANSFEDNLKDSKLLKTLFLKIYNNEKVVIGKIQGHAIAGGAGLAAVCDFSFTVPEAKFGYTEVRIGFIPAIVMVFLIRKIGEAKAKELLLSGRLVDSSIALNMGLVNYVVNKDELDSKVNEFARELIMKNSGQSMKSTKRMITEVQSMDLETALDFAAGMNAKARETEDCRKGIDAFLSKDEISW